MQKFTTAAPIAAVLDIPVGRLRFIAADRADTTVEILPADASRGRDVTAAERTTVAYADGILRIAAAAPRNRILGGSGSVEVTVRLPTGSRVEARTASAEIRGVGRLGDVTIDSAHGAIKLDETAGARLALQAGDITVGRLGGSAEITTQKGGVHVTEAVRGTVVLRTQAGDISVGAARGTRATLDAGTSYGRIRNALTHDGSGRDLTLHATTAYGDIAARSL
ncbi:MULTISPECIES: DUF4097 family beta strand repeat-containing protein [unclassified Streptomyces]|uniref:DUF4097 family beta strand repeat-containing protein n=1 Tax=unclassified Streptomyces TaxID=2593676 RepID=UPI0004453A94|nr:DUF4097 family beta strand repeat-containing protein [Streptomyces sp. PCS3-D2]WKV73554.1 DUF4097 domain-containing protein [Streptomyces sp. PCS3-D2]